MNLALRNEVAPFAFRVALFQLQCQQRSFIAYLERALADADNKLDAEIYRQEIKAAREALSASEVAFA